MFFYVPLRLQAHTTTVVLTNAHLYAHDNSCFSKRSPLRTRQQVQRRFVEAVQEERQVGVHRVQDVHRVLTRRRRRQTTLL